MSKTNFKQNSSNSKHTVTHTHTHLHIHTSHLHIHTLTVSPMLGQLGGGGVGHAGHGHRNGGMGDNGHGQATRRLVEHGLMGDLSAMVTGQGLQQTLEQTNKQMNTNR